jgi:hypothetical protein
MGISFICRGEVQLLDGDALGLGGLAPGHSDAEEAVGVLGLGLGSVGIFGQTDDGGIGQRNAPDSGKSLFLVRREQVVRH